MQHYALFVVLVPMLCLAVIALTNRIIDPYQIFSAERDAVYQDKPALHANMRLHKAFQIRLQKPDALILGSSKAIQGIPTEHAAFDGKRVYNLAMPLASMQELTYLLRHANAVQPIGTVVLGLDFLSFNALARTDGPAAGFKPERLLGHDGTVSIFHDYLSALVSLDALLASWQVLRIRQSLSVHSTIHNAREHRVLTGKGGREDAEIRSRLLDGGHRSNTLRIEEFFTRAVYLPSPHRQFSFENGGQNSLYWYGEFLRTLHENKIQALLYISPSHARLQELIDAAGLWPQLEQWKRQLVILTNQIAQDYMQDPYRLVDFSVPGTITTEPFPVVQDSNHQMDYYYESIHFNQRTGTRALDRLYSDLKNTALLPASDFGRILNDETIEAVLKESRDRQARFRLDYPDYRQELEKIIQNR